MLVYNLLLIAGLALTGWTTSLVVARWTGSRMAGLLSGSLIAFNAMTLTRFAEIQDQHLEFFPLVLVALDRLLVLPRVKDALRLAGWFVVQALTGGYLLAFMSLARRRGAGAPGGLDGPAVPACRQVVAAGGSGRRPRAHAVPAAISSR